MARALAYYPVLSLFLVLTFVLPAIPCSGQSSRTDVTGSISTNTVWNLAGSPYHVTQDVTVESGVGLNIQGGVVVKFDQYSQLIIKGSLVATGVTFTSASGSPNPGDWSGLSFQSANQAQTVLDNIKIMYAFTNLEVKGSLVSLRNAEITKFSSIGVSVSDGGIINITKSVIKANQGTGIECKGILQAYEDTIMANYAVKAESSCTGTIDRSVITANTFRGVDAASDTTLVIQNSLINSTSPENSYGVSADTGSKLVLKGDDIVGHMTCIDTVTSSITVDRVSVRNYAYYGIDSEAPITIVRSFAGTPNPVGKDKTPAPGNDKVSFESPLAAPFDIDAIPQPASVVIINPAASASVTGKVAFSGMAWEPDKVDTITKVEIRIIKEDDTEVVPWTNCVGTNTWTYNWNLKDSSTTDYKVYVRATTTDGEVMQAPAMTVVSDPYGSGYNPFTSLMTLYLNICYGILITIIIVAVFAIYYFMFYKKKKDVQASAVQPAYQQPYVNYQPQYQYTPVPQPAPTVQAPIIEDYVIEDVFLVYKDGRLLHHDTRRLRPEVDEQSLGGMFTAILDFIGQSFPAEDGTKGQIKEIMYEDNKILLEHGKYVYLAVVAGSIKDTKALHKRMSKLLKAIEEACAVNFIGWDGNLESVSQAKRMTKLIYTDEDIDNYVD
jgi:hypothetical protein